MVSHTNVLKIINNSARVQVFFVISVAPKFSWYHAPFHENRNLLTSTPTHSLRYRLSSNLGIYSASSALPSHPTSSRIYHHNRPACIMDDIISGVSNVFKKVSDLLPSFSDATAKFFSSRKRPRSPALEPPEPSPTQHDTARRDAFKRAQEHRINVLPSNLRTNSRFKRHRSSIDWTPGTSAFAGLGTPANGQLGATPAWRSIVPRTLRLSTESPYYTPVPGIPAPRATFGPNPSAAPNATTAPAAALSDAVALRASNPTRPPPLSQNAISPRAAPLRRRTYEFETTLTKLERLKSTKKYEMRNQVRQVTASSNRGITTRTTHRTANGHSFLRNCDPLSFRSRDSAIRKVQSARAFRATSSRALDGIQREISRILSTNRESLSPSYPPTKGSSVDAVNIKPPSPVTQKRPRSPVPVVVDPPTRITTPDEVKMESPPKSDVEEVQPDGAEVPLPRPRTVKSLDLAKWTGVSREKLNVLFTPEVVTLMETNPLLCEKVLKSHAANMDKHLRLPGQREERKKHIEEIQDRLAKSIAESRAYIQQQEQERKLREAARANVPNGSYFSRSEKPPSSDSEQFLISYDDGYDGNYEETPESLQEKEEARTVVDENSAFSPLTPNAVKRVRSVLGASNYSNVGRTLYAKISGCTVHGSDLQTLKPNTWLNDEIVNSYLELLFRRNELALKDAETNGTKPPPRVRFMSSFFYARLFANNPAQGCYVYDYTRVRRWTKKFDVFGLDMLVIPINQHNMHWTLGVVNLRDKRVEHYDSFGGSQSGQILDNLLKWVADERENKKGDSLDIESWEKVPMTGKMPQQNNCDDCGVFVCKFADFITRGAEVTFEARHMRYFRARIAHEIMMQRVA